MRFVVLSDTHGKHHYLRNLPAGDAIIHAGDVTSRGTEEEVLDFLKWFSELDYRYKIFIAGNHDFLFEDAEPAILKLLIPGNIIYLDDSGITIEGIHIWGSPVTPWFYDWAFNRHRGADIARHWALIPQATDILIVHGPPYGILDLTTTGTHAGCEELRKATERIQPAYCVFGHIHEAQGTHKEDATHYVNAAVLNARYRLKYPPKTFDFCKEKE